MTPHSEPDPSEADEAGSALFEALQRVVNLIEIR